MFLFGSDLVFNERPDLFLDYHIQKVDSFEKKILEARVNYKKRLNEDHEKISAEVNEKIKKDYESIIGALKKEVGEKSDIIVKTKLDEIELRKQKKELEEKQQLLELDVLKRLEEERQKIKNDAIQKTEEMHRFKELEIVDSLEKAREKELPQFSLT